MQTPKVREKLMKLPRASMTFGKIRAVFQSARALPAGSEQTESVESYKIAEEYRPHQLEVERFKATAEEYAQNLRRRLV